MLLKRLTLHGFKTFANRTTFEFHGGITAVIGPNGSGKSNLADARHLIEAWRLDYNEVRPHSALGNLPPLAFAQRSRLDGALSSAVA